MYKLAGLLTFCVMFVTVPAASANQFYIDGGLIPEGRNMGVIEYGTIFVREYETKLSTGERREVKALGPCSFTAVGRVYNSAGLGHLEVRNTDGFCRENPYVPGNAILQGAVGVAGADSRLEGDYLVGQTEAFRTIEAGNPPVIGALYSPLPTGSMRFENPPGPGLAVINPNVGSPQFPGNETIYASFTHQITGNIDVQAWARNLTTNMPSIITEH